MTFMENIDIQTKRKRLASLAASLPCVFQGKFFITSAIHFECYSVFLLNIYTHCPQDLHQQKQTIGANKTCVCHPASNSNNTGCPDTSLYQQRWSHHVIWMFCDPSFQVSLLPLPNFPGDLLVTHLKTLLFRCTVSAALWFSFLNSL